MCLLTSFALITSFLRTEAIVQNSSKVVKSPISRQHNFLVYWNKSAVLEQCMTFKNCWLTVSHQDSNVPVKKRHIRSKQALHRGDRVIGEINIKEKLHLIYAATLHVPAHSQSQLIR